MCGLVVKPMAASAGGALRLPRLDPETPAYRVASGGAAAAVLPLRAPGPPEIRIRLGDPAARAMIDLARTRAVTVPEDCGIDRACDDMRRAGVPALLVLRDGQVIGLATEEDVNGGRAVRFLDAHPDLQRDQLRVREILIPCAEIPSVDWSAVRDARVSDLLELFQAAGYAHLAVVEHADGGRTLARGLVSRARLERQLEFR